MLTPNDLQEIRKLILYKIQGIIPWTKVEKGWPEDTTPERSQHRLDEWEERLARLDEEIDRTRPWQPQKKKEI